MFGDIPLVLTLNGEVTPPRNPKAEIYAQIISDLDFAKQNLPESYPPTTAWAGDHRRCGWAAS
ncbi:MAG: hypothetical protein IPM82_31035 [Saprospiraceae bacterium]|nr:hypothetical protein [Saprospiraceae bacterium]